MRSIREKISIVIPVYNEEKIIYSNLKEVKKTFDEFGCNYEIIVCDDGSRDSSIKEVLNFVKDHKDLCIKITHNRSNYGKGRTLKKAFKYVTGDYVIFLDGDLDLHPTQIPTFFDIMRLTEADIIIGSKRHPNSVLHYPLNRKVMSFVYFSMIKSLFGLPINDTQTGLKLFKREVLQDVFKRILVKKFAFDLEVLVVAHHLGYRRIIEAPVKFRLRSMGSKISTGAVRNFLQDMAAIFYRRYLLRYYDREISPPKKKRRQKRTKKTATKKSRK